MIKSPCVSYKVFTHTTAGSEEMGECRPDSAKLLFMQIVYNDTVFHEKNLSIVVVLNAVWTFLF